MKKYLEKVIPETSTLYFNGHPNRGFKETANNWSFLLIKNTFQRADYANKMQRNGATLMRLNQTPLDFW